MYLNNDRNRLLTWYWLGVDIVFRRLSSLVYSSEVSDELFSCTQIGRNSGIKYCRWKHFTPRLLRWQYSLTMLKVMFYQRASLVPEEYLQQGIGIGAWKVRRKWWYRTKSSACSYVFVTVEILLKPDFRFFFLSGSFSSRFFWGDYSFGGTIHENKYDCPSDLRNWHLIPSKSASSGGLKRTPRKKKKTGEIENLEFKFNNVLLLNNSDSVEDPIPHNKNARLHG